MDHFDTTTSTGSVGGAGENAPAFDFSALDDAIVETIEKKELYFVPDIAGHLGIQSGLAYERLTELEKAGRVEAKQNGDGPRAYYAVEQEQRPGEPKQPDMAADHAKSVGHVPAAGEPGFDKLSEEEIKERVLAAIDAGYRSYVGIKKQVGAPAAFDLSDVLEEMCGDYVLRKHPAGSITAFFRYETMPLRIRLVGNGKVEADFDENFKPRDERAKQAEFAGVKIRDDDDDLLDLGEPAKRGKQRKEIDEDDLEDAAATEANFEGVAEKLGVSVSILQSRLAESPLLRAALSDGIGRNTSYTVSTKPAPKPADDERGGAQTSSAAPSLPGGVLSETYIEKLASEDPDVASIAARAGKTEAEIRKLLDAHPLIKKAWKRGRAMYQQKHESKSETNGAAPKRERHGVPRTEESGGGGHMSAMDVLVKQLADEMAGEVASIVLRRVRSEVGAMLEAGVEFGWLEDELAKKLYCDPQTIAKLRKAKEIDHTYNPAGRPFYMKHHVLDYLLRNEIRSGKSVVSAAEVLHFKRSLKEVSDERKDKAA